MASVELEDVDVKGAVRELCSDDPSRTVPDDTTLTDLSHLHPVAPTDRRHAPSTTMPPLQVLPDTIKSALQSFPNGSAAGQDGLRSEHMKNLVIRTAVNNLPLVAISGLVNLLLEGKTSTVRGASFVAILLAIAKKQLGGIRPTAVGYVWR